jgi:hypothetical protein
MTNKAPKRYVERFLEVAEDTDWSRYSRLQDLTQADLRAAAEALWQHSTRTRRYVQTLPKNITSDDVERVLMTYVGTWEDENHVVSEIYRSFMDRVDEMGLSQGTRDRIVEDLYQQWAGEVPRTVVNNVDGIRGFYGL